MELKQWLSEIKTKISENQLYIVGYGNYGRIIVDWLNRNDISIAGIIDKNTTNNCISYDYRFEENACFLISSLVHMESMKEELIKRDIQEERIISNIQQEYIYTMLDEENDICSFLNKNSKFRSIKEGRKCFIVGNGPSLRISDLEMLSDYDTFACNSLYKIFSKTKWRPTYYCGVDPTFCRVDLGTQEKAEYLAREVEYLFTSVANDGFRYRDSISNMRYVKTNNWSLNGYEEPFFANDITNGVCISGTTTYLAIQLAAYMGYKEIYLLGMDFSFSVERSIDGKLKFNDTKNHLDLTEDEEVDELNKKLYGYTYIADIDIQKAEYMKAKEYANLHGIKIYNATRGGKLEVFERVDFESLFC